MITPFRGFDQQPSLTSHTAQKGQVMTPSPPSSVGAHEIRP